MIVFEGAGHST